MHGRSWDPIRSGLAGLLAVGLLLSGLGPASGGTAQAAKLAAPLANCPAGTDANGNCLPVPQPITAVQPPTPAATAANAAIDAQRAAVLQAQAQSLVNAFFGVAYGMIIGEIPDVIGFPILLTYRRWANSFPEPYRSQIIAEMSFLFR